MKIFLVYAFQPGSDRVDSPFCITNNLHRYLSERAQVTYDVWDSKRLPEPDPRAIFIGHPHYDPQTIVQQVFQNNIKFKARCSIHPFHHIRSQDNWPFDDIAQKADQIFSICGPYWYDTIEETKFKHWKPKMTRLDMAIDTNHFPFFRKKFNQVGKRKLIYIGSSMPQKNLGYMVQIMQQMPDVKLKWVGADGNHPLAKLRNVEPVGWQHLTHQVSENLVNECDIFINTSISDANPTTLLEARSLGFITACTPQSGYYNDPFFTELTIGDLDQSVNAIRKLLNENDNVLMKRAIKSRAEIESKYTWDRFCETVWQGLVNLDKQCSN